MTVDQRRREYVERLVAVAPPLSPNQRDRLAGLLRGSHRAPLTSRRAAARFALIPASTTAAHGEVEADRT